MDKNAWKDVLVSPEMTVIATLESISKSALQIALVVDEKQCLLGVVTDGDVRRHLLSQGKLDEPVLRIMNKNPAVGTLADTKEYLLIKMKNKNILHLPIVDDNRRVIGLELFSCLTNKNKRENWVIFMAGGLGTRLHPLTLDYPKPLVKIWNKTILELLLENFIQNGFYRFYFSVNYKAQMIEAYFGNGERWGVEIRYLHEERASGTIGSLQLLQEKPEQSFFVLNADIVTNLNFSCILDFHKNNNQNPIATMCVRQYDNRIPYGVVKVDDRYHYLLDIEEKPIRSYFINAGIYILEPTILECFPKNQEYLDMPNLLLHLVGQKKCVSTFPIQEYWLDIGSHENLMQATNDYQRIFV
ncbi:MAG: nucleotidyltransferase family protein [Coxiellaceae bacterium]|nr:nucleotidyltransferase family protein [Coxiellaceae bacterium]